MRLDILSPKSGIVFRAVFRRPEVLRPFLPAVLGIDRTELRQIRVADPRRRERAGSKEIIFDILAVLGEDGGRCGLEMRQFRPSCQEGVFRVRERAWTPVTETRNAA